MADNVVYRVVGYHPVALINTCLSTKALIEEKKSASPRAKEKG